jgi:uncharacterized protein
MRMKYALIVALFLMALTLSACGSAALAQSEQPTTRTIQVTGSSQIFVTPDIARITIGVRAEDAEASAALQKNNTLAQLVIATIKGFAVEDKDIQTTNFNIYQRQDYDDRGTITNTTYVVENNVLVTVRDLDRLGSLLDQVVSSGANTVFGIQFDVADKNSALSEARQAAVNDARDQAEELAQAAGVRLGAVQSMQMSSGYPSPIYQDLRFATAEQAAIPISPGQASISVDISVVFEIN